MDRERVAPAVAELADELGRTIDVAVQEQQLGTGHAVRCGLSALPDDFAGTVVVTSGDVPLLDADTLADLIATHSAEPAAATVLTTDAARSDRLRPHPARPRTARSSASSSRPTPRPSQRAIREVNAGVYAFDIAALRSALSRLRSDNAQQELYLTDVISIVRSDGQRRAGQARRRLALVAGRQRPRAAGRAGRRAEPAHRRRASARRA